MIFGCVSDLVISISLLALSSFASDFRKIFTATFFLLITRPFSSGVVAVITMADLCLVTKRGAPSKVYGPTFCGRLGW